MTTDVITPDRTTRPRPRRPSTRSARAPATSSAPTRCTPPRTSRRRSPAPARPRPGGPPCRTTSAPSGSTAWKGVITRRIAQLADVVHQETGKPHSDATLEAALALDHLAWAAKHAEKVLRPPQGVLRAGDGQPGGDRRVPPARRRRRDRPVELPGLHADGLDRLRAGRRQRGGVQAERAHARGRASGWRRRFAEVVPEHPVFQVVTGLGETGAALCRAGVDKLAFTGSTATGKKVMAACAETLTPVRDRGRRQGRRARRRGRRPRRGRRRRALGRLLQRRPDLHRRRARSTSTSGSTTSSCPALARQGARPARRRQPGRQDRADHDARPARHHPLAHRRRPRPRRPGGARRSGRGRGALRAADDPGRRARGLLGRAGGDLRPDRDGHQGAGHGRGRRPRPTAPATGWARRCSPRRAAWSSPSGSGRG